jgi:hypothetical protein
LALLSSGQPAGVGLAPRLKAQVLSCPDVVKQALDLVVNECGDLERNRACYGNILLDASPKEGIDPQTFAFSQPGDTVPIRDLGTLKLTQFNAETGTWGVAALRAQANLPGTGVGQAVTMILFGDTEVTDASEEQDGTFKAFYLRTGLGKPGCTEMPRNGLLLQSPKGGQKVEMTANGVNLKIGSTVFLFADAEEGEEEPQLWIHTIEGEVEVTSDEVTVIVEGGKQACVPLRDEDADDPNIDPAGPPCAPEDLDEEETEGLPIDTLTELYANHLAYDVQTLPTLTATATSTTRPVIRRRTRTFTPSPTATSTPLPPQPPPPTATPNGTATPTSTASASVTASITSSATVTDMPTLAPTNTPTFTWTPAPTDTFTPVPTDTPTPPADTCSIAGFGASPTTAILGESVTLSWTVIGAVNATTLISPIGGRTGVGASGSQVIAFGINEGFAETWSLEAQCVDMSITIATTTISPVPN